MNIVLITSVINTPKNIPWSYSNVRSVFNREERYNQLKLTIISAKEKIPNNKILLVECSEFTKEEQNYFEKECDYILNLWDRKDLHKFIFSPSKALGFGLMIIEGINYLTEKNLKFEHFVKMGGRYWLNDDFDYKQWDNDKIVVNKIRGDPNNIQVGYFKIPYNLKENLKEFLVYNMDKMKSCIGFEVLFSEFVNNNIKIVKYIDKIGMEGYVSVCGSFWKN